MLFDVRFIIKVIYSGGLDIKYHDVWWRGYSDHDHAGFTFNSLFEALRPGLLLEKKSFWSLSKYDILANDLISDGANGILSSNT